MKSVSDKAFPFRDKIVQVLKFVLFFGLGLFIIWFFQRNLTPQDRQEIVSSLQQARWGMIVLIILFGFLSNVFRTLRWNLLLHPMGYKPRFPNTFMSVLVAYFANLAIPRLGEVLRCTFMYRYEKIPVEKSLGTVVSERVLDMICFVLIFLSAFIIEYQSLKEYLLGLLQTREASGDGTSWGLWLIVGLFILGLLFLAGLVIYYRKNKDHLSPDSRLVKVVGIFKGFGEGLMSLGRIHRPYLFVLSTIGIWFCYWAMMYFAFLSIPSLAGAGPGIALIALATGTVGVMITPGGIGIYPVIISQTLAIFGFSRMLGYSAGWIAWGTQTAVIILAGILALVILPWYNRRR